MTNQTTDNPLLTALKARLPGETFRLPSQGLFYDNGELSDDVKNGEVHVFPLTALDEILLKTPDKLMSGNAIVEVFSRCVPQIKKPMELLAKDIDYLLMCLRLISYGETVDITYTHTCEGAKERTYTVELRPLISRTKPIDPTSVGSSNTIMLPSQQTVVIRPPLYGSIMRLYIGTFEMQRMSEDEQFKAGQEQLLDIVTDTIQSVDGIKDRAQIREWIRALPAGWMEDISNATHAISEWGPSSSWSTTCKDCGEEITIDIPLNPIAFFS